MHWRNRFGTCRRTRRGGLQRRNAGYLCSIVRASYLMVYNDAMRGNPRRARRLPESIDHRAAQSAQQFSGDRVMSVGLRFREAFVRAALVVRLVAASTLILGVVTHACASERGVALPPPTIDSDP